MGVSLPTVVGMLLALTVVSPTLPRAVAATPAPGLPPGFQETTVFSGLDHPTTFDVASDGRVFVAEKSGLIKVFPSLTSQTSMVAADLRPQVYNYWDRGLLSIALDPSFPATPYLYALYTVDAPPGGVPPVYNDSCADPSINGCTAFQRLSRLTIQGNTAVAEEVLADGWCVQFPSHSIGTLRFAPDGALLVSSGDGASFDFVDTGQAGNPCGDPTKQGGAIRSQSFRRPATTPAVMNGTILRVQPVPGLPPVANNANIANADPVRQKIVAYGLRNPYRFTLRPGTDDVWIGDVGWNALEEVDRLADPRGATQNFGWPCYEAYDQLSGYQTAPLCSSLPFSATTSPEFAYAHSGDVANEAGKCPPTTNPVNVSSSITGDSFYEGDRYPARYQGALFFADYSRNCIWAMLPGTDGLPDASRVEVFETGSATPVELKAPAAANGDLLYVDHGTGSIRRISFTSANNRPPVAAITTTPSEPMGNAPLLVEFDGGSSNDPNGDPLTYSWNFGDGTTGTGVQVSHTYGTVGQYSAQLTVHDPFGGENSTSVLVSAGVSTPIPVIDAPSTALQWRVGETISFSGSAADPIDGPLPPTALHWHLVLHHCSSPDNCHVHDLQSWDDTAIGSFIAPNHAYPSWLELQLSATNAHGVTGGTSVRLDASTTTIDLNSSPPGIDVSISGVPAATPSTVTVIEGSTQTVSAPPTLELDGAQWDFAGWNDGGFISHDVTVNAPLSLTANYVQRTGGATGTGYWLAEADGSTHAFGSAIATVASATAVGAPAGELRAQGTNDAFLLNAPIDGIASSPSGAGYWLVGSDGGIFAFGDAGFFGSTGNLALNAPIVAITATPSGNGYWFVASDGGIFSFGDAPFFGSTGGMRLNAPIVGMAATPTGDGYWLVASDGGIFSFGDASFFGSTGAMRLNQPVVGMAATPTGDGYWLVASDGGIFSFGDASFFGSTGDLTLRRPIVGMAAVPSGTGYWMVASDGGIFNFGAAPFLGSLGDAPQASPIVAMAIR